MGDAWEWDLAEGTTILARLELPARIESVWLGQRLVSRSAAGGKGSDHVVPLPAPKTVETPKQGDAYRAAPPPSEATVTFDPIGAHCTLRLDGVVMPPTREPEDAIAASSRYGEARAPRILGMQRKHAVVVLPIAAALLVALVVPPTLRGIVARRARAKIADATTETARTESLEAPDRSLIAHFPADFESTLDEQGAFISLHRPKKLEMIVLISTARSDVDDPRDLDRIMTKDLIAYATKTGATMSTTITVDGECHGFPGVISTATLSKPDVRSDIPLKVTSCTALQNGRGYFFATFVPEFLAETEEPELQRIVNATDVFDVPPPSGFAVNGTADFDDGPSRGRVTFSAQGSTFGFGAIPRPTSTTGTARPTFTASPRPVRPPPPRPLPSPSPTPAIRFGANGSVESSGPQHVNGVNKASDAANDAKMRAYRQRVPW
jgi:hypothetical protein